MRFRFLYFRFARVFLGGPSGGAGVELSVSMDATGEAGVGVWGSSTISRNEEKPERQGKTRRRRRIWWTFGFWSVYITGIREQNGTYRVASIPP